MLRMRFGEAPGVEPRILGREGPLDHRACGVRVARQGPLLALATRHRDSAPEGPYGVPGRISDRPFRFR
jgi:hypothetical protein